MYEIYVCGCMRCVFKHNSCTSFSSKTLNRTMVGDYFLHIFGDGAVLLNRETVHDTI